MEEKIEQTIPEIDKLEENPKNDTEVEEVKEVSQPENQVEETKEEKKVECAQERENQMIEQPLLN